MSWLFSQALVAASSADTCSDGGLSAPSSTTPTPQAYLWRDKTTDAWNRFPSGMTCEPLTDDRGEELLTSFLAAFPAKTFQPQEEAQESTASEAVSGPKWRESLAKYDPDSRSWKTRQCLLLGGLEEYAEAWPNWGMTRDGELFRRPTPSLVLAIRLRITCGKESGLSLPTPRANDAEKRGDFDANNPRNGLPAAVKRLSLPTPTARDWLSGKASEATMQRNSRPLSEKVGGKLNPQWVEWLMGWPIGWTDLGPLATDKFQQWCCLHGDC